MYKELTEIASVIFKNLERMGETTKNRETRNTVLLFKEGYNNETSSAR